MIKIDSLPGTEEAVMEEGGKFEIASKLTGPVSIFTYYYFFYSLKLTYLIDSKI